MNVALFGGTFDPVHCGHLMAAQAAMSAFGLDQIHFVPSSIPPHKRSKKLTPYVHRFAMVSLACAGVPQFVPSLLESPEQSDGKPNYSQVTVAKMSALLAPTDRLHFIIGADAFLEIGGWHEPVALLDSCDFIVISRPGFPIGDLAKVIPAELNGREVTPNHLALRKSSVHLLTSVASEVSASAIRTQVAEKKSLAGIVPDVVAEYIVKQNLYVNEK